MICHTVVHSSGDNKEGKKRFRYIPNWTSNTSKYFSCTKVLGILYYYIFSLSLSLSVWLCRPARAMASSFLDHTQRRATVRRTPLDVWSARRRDLYLSVSQPPSRGPVTGPGINYTGPREVNFTLNNIINFWWSEWDMSMKISTN
jgi:hypothetical protein